MEALGCRVQAPGRLPRGQQCWKDKGLDGCRGLGWGHSQGGVSPPGVCGARGGSFWRCQAGVALWGTDWATELQKPHDGLVRATHSGNPLSFPFFPLTREQRRLGDRMWWCGGPCRTVAALQRLKRVAWKAQCVCTGPHTLRTRDRTRAVRPQTPDPPDMTLGGGQGLGEQAKLGPIHTVPAAPCQHLCHVRAAWSSSLGTTAGSDQWQGLPVHTQTACPRAGAAGSGNRSWVLRELLRQDDTGVLGRGSQGRTHSRPEGLWTAWPRPPSTWGPGLGCRSLSSYGRLRHMA